jgi:hypothetical protein
VTPRSTVPSSNCRPVIVTVAGPAARALLSNQRDHPAPSNSQETCAGRRPAVRLVLSWRGG